MEYDNPYIPQEYLKEFANKLNVTPTIIYNGGHLNKESGFTKFPELLEDIRQKVLNAK